MRNLRHLLLGVAFAAILSLSYSPIQFASAAPACGYVQVAASAWFQGHGVDVHSNGIDQTTGYSCAGVSFSNPTVQNGGGWQCVELASRFYYVKGWGSIAGNAVNIPNANPQLSRHNNNTGYTPVAGDLIVENATSKEPYGHVVVVDRITGTSIYAVEQNASSTGWHTYYLGANGNVTGAYTSVEAVMHAPLNSPPPVLPHNSGGVALRSDGVSGYSVDGFGKITAFGGAPVVSGITPPFTSNLVRGIVLRSNGVSGYVLDAWGAVHPFGGAPTISNGPYWSGQDYARGITLDADGLGGQILDLFGAPHAFGNASTFSNGPYWPGQDYARGIVLDSDGQGGQILDLFGAPHAFGNAPTFTNGPYWPGQDMARGVALTADNQGAYILDAWGAVHTAGNAQPVPSGLNYHPNIDTARGLVVRPCPDNVHACAAVLTYNTNSPASSVQTYANWPLN